MNINILFLADLHGTSYHEWQNFLKIDKESFDEIILLGDIDIIFLKSIKENFPERRILGVHGNHDYIGDLEYFGIENIHGKSIKLEGIVVSALEGCLKYKKDNPLLHTDEEIFNIIKTFDFNTDIIISHNSPLGIHDKEDVAHRGYSALRNFIEEYIPKYCIHGHQHINKITKYGDTKIVGIYTGAIVNISTGNINQVI